MALSPYDSEFASYKPLHRVAAHPRVQAVLEACRKRDPDTHEESPLDPTAVAPSNQLPDWVIALDGSYQQTEVENGFPGAEVCYMTVAAVMLDVLKMRELDRQRPVHPKEFRSTQRTGSLDCALPGCNVIFKNEASSSASFRRAFFEETRAVSSTDGGESLLETYEALLARKPGGSQDRPCPYDDCDDGGGKPCAQNVAPGCVDCVCSKKRRWYSTDALRIDMGLNPTGPSGAMYGEVMQVWERLFVINIIRSMIEKGWASSFSRVAIVLDGPLAVFGHPAWLSQAIIAELSDLNGKVRTATGGKDLLLVGIEKAGTFVEHFGRMDQTPGTKNPRYPNQSVFLLSNDYIRSHIVVSEGKPHGLDTYFGRKIFYKTKSGARIVATLPIISREAQNRDDVRPQIYPRLADALTLLDSLVSSRFPNALAPLVAAHAEAAIPLNLGKRVLEQLAKELLAQPKAPS